MEGSAAPEVRITLAGEVGIEAGGTRTEAAGLGRLGRVAVAYLVSERHRPVPRGELAEVLWGEAVPRSWETSLRVLASRVRGWLTSAGMGGSEALTSAFGCYQLHLPEGSAVDVEEAAAALDAARAALGQGDPDRARAAAAAAVSVAAREFLPGASGAWAERRQAEVRELRLTALETLADAALAAGDPAASLSAAEEVVAQDLLRESGYLRVMAAHAASGNRGAALRAYERGRHLLAEELGISPSATFEGSYLSLLRDDAPPPERSATAARGPARRRSKLPAPLSSFVGRQTEVAGVAARVRSARLVTLLGPGGMGKTRLALEVAAAMEAEHADGAAVVSLADVTRPEDVPIHILTALAALAAAPAGGQGQAAPLETLADMVADQDLLLVLDNCEHLVEGAARLVDHLLRTAANLTVLATSREPLGVAGEVSWPVPSLAAADAVRLFADRARAARPGFQPTPAEEATVAAICEGLDGIPLAIELAAARTAHLSVDEIAERLGDRFGLLAGGPRTVAPRHQNLRASIDWTYESLGPAEADLFHRLSAFAGSFTLAAAEFVTEDREVFATLMSLLSRSLILAEPAGATTRYRLLETIRAYASEKLEASGQAEKATTRLRAWAVDLAERAEPHLDGPDQAAWFQTLEAELPNLRAALAGRPPGVEALRVSTALGRFWEVRGHLEEGRRVLRKALDHAGDSPLDLQARAQNLAGVLAQRQGDYAAARSRYEAGLALRRRLDDRLGAAVALHGLGNLAALGRNPAEAGSLYEQSLALGRELGEPALIAASVANLGWVAHATGDFPAAHARYGEALALRRELGDEHGVALVLGHLGDLAYQEGNYAAARALHDESLTLRTALGDKAGRADSLATLGHLSLQAGDAPGARTQLEESLALRRELDDRAALPAALSNLADLALVAGELDDARRHLAEAEAAARAGRDQPALAHVLVHQARLARAEGDLGEAATRYLQASEAAGDLGAEPLTAEWLEGVGATLAATGDPETGARLIGTADALRLSIGAPVPPHERAVHEGDVASASTALGRDRFTAAWEAGRALPLHEALSDAVRALGAV